MQQIERAIFDLRRGLPVVIQSGDTSTLIAPVESLDEPAREHYARLSGSPASLVLTAHRLRRLLPNHGDKAGRLPLQHGEKAAEILDYATAIHTPWPATQAICPASDVDQAALTLANRGQLLPAMLVMPVAPEQADEVSRQIAHHSLLAVEATVILAYTNTPTVRRVSEARLPLALAADSQLVVFRQTDGFAEHVAVLIGPPAHWADAVPLRLHSACLTGDLFGSLRCDCGTQLKRSMTQIAKLGGGVLLYLNQEGRSIGLANKMRAYRLQDHGLDTIDADQTLGFGADGRDYRVALDMLASLGIARVELLTNNPNKYAALSAGGIEIVNRRSVYGELTDDNVCYLQTKAERAGHWLDGLVSLSNAGNL